MRKLLPSCLRHSIPLPNIKLTLPQQNFNVQRISYNDRYRPIARSTCNTSCKVLTTQAPYNRTTTFVKSWTKLLKLLLMFILMSVFFTESVDQPDARHTWKACYAPKLLGNMRTAIQICGRNAASQPLIGHMRRAVWGNTNSKPMSGYRLVTSDLLWTSPLRLNLLPVHFKCGG
jgi:hypothetical protein